ncbi:MAG: alpha amylase C-terminal domain-containing protein [Bacteroidales bacterium]|nr:alpha amylase C-terminal domain-containing protein [Bacteroidales bacterium]
MKKIIIVIAAVAALFSCTPKQEAAHHPEWTYNSVIYEVNIRQYSPEGTFAGVQAQLPRLKELGVDILWLMPMYQIGVEGRKGTLGSYYAISDYCKVNPEFGTMEDFDNLLAAAHELGFKVILDWVANQTAPDHIWMESKPAEFYERDSLGNATWEYDWTDTRSLNYDCKEVWEAQVECMRFWLDKGVDGFRCDAAGEMPAEFWQSVMPGLNADYPEAYFLAEAERPNLANPDSCFDATYAWELHHMLNDIAAGQKDFSELRAYLQRDEQNYPASAYRMTFTSNHDENSWQGTEFERMGDCANACEVLCFTLPKSQPLVYTGQEIGLSRRLQFFEKDPIEDWSDNGFTDFFKKLVELKHNNPALAAGERGGSYLDIPQNGDGIYAFSRTKGKNSVIVAVNMGTEAAHVALPLDGEYTNLFTGETLSGTYLAPLDAAGYLVLYK